MWLTLLVACGPTYTDVQRLDTIEAYEGFLAADPETLYKNPIEKRLEELYYDRAQKEDSLASWEAYTTRFVLGGKHYPEALKRHAQLSYRIAVADGTQAGLKAYLDKFGKADQVLASRAAGWLAAQEYGKLELSAPRVEKVNLAEDPKGDLNGWGVSVDVTNAGDVAFAHLRLTVEWRDDAGNELSTQDYPLVSDRWTLPATDEQKAPFLPGQTRTWQWTEDFKVLSPDRAPGAFVYPSAMRAVEKK